jgi:hypothetical protein
MEMANGLRPASVIILQARADLLEIAAADRAVAAAVEHQDGEMPRLLPRKIEARRDGERQLETGDWLAGN